MATKLSLGLAEAAAGGRVMNSYDEEEE